MNIQSVACGMLLGFLICTSALAAKVDRAVTRYGTLEVKSGAHESPPDALFLNGKLIYRAENFYLGIYGVYKGSNQDIAVIGVNCGGSGCTNDDLVVATITSRSNIKFIEDKQLHSVDGTVKIAFIGHKLSIDLGYEEGKIKRATFEDGSLVISLERPKSVVPLAKSDCEWIYDSALDGCIMAKQEDPRCQDPQSTFPMVLVRGLSALSQHPAFSSGKFTDVCRQVCATGRAPRLEPFKENFCLIK
jgi:hypothetical protein